MNTKLRILLIIMLLVVFATISVYAQEPPPTEETEVAGEVAEIDIVEVLTQLVPQPPGSSITVVPGQNKLIVRNTPSNLRKIEKFMQDLATPPQVAIEAKFVIVGEETYRDLGLEWNSLSFNWANPIGRDQRYSGIAGQPWSYDTITGSITSGASITPPPHVLGGGGFQIAYTSTNYPQIQATLYMLSTRSDTKFLSAPTITTLNNEPATIRFVKTINFFEDVEIETETDDDTGITTTNYDWTFTERDIGIILYVSPLVIKPTKSVRLFLQPVVSDIEGEDAFTLFLIDGVPFNAALPRFTSKDATTNVDVYDGTTIVLGGLMSETATEIVSKVPFLGDIPVIGKAFWQREAKSSERQHLLIFITVNVLDSKGNPYFARG
ncbi:MAG: hypothetical protein PHW62_02250 [Candidatus Ratteibacteria bacterium]|nr:hypothetical protein [Candidatus Ratteibacteria bacterium]